MPPPPSSTYQRLRETIAKQMRMSPIDQPLMLMELLGRRSPAPAQDVARRILGRAWRARFTFNGITAYGNSAYSLIGGDELSDAERDALQQLCRQRLDAFREQHGEEVFAHRSRHRTPISGSVKYRVHRCARGRCECCGAHEHQRALEVDHIVPKNQGGSDSITNLQALCFRCNAGKRDTDRTDFRGMQASYGHREAGCVFCALKGSGRMLLESELALCISDAYPVSEGHSLVIPRRHVNDGLALHQPEWNSIVELLQWRRKVLEDADSTITGFNVGLNSGASAGQTVFHAHWHLIPRRNGDTDEPRGGVRGVIPGRMNY
ncbi:MULTISPECIES: HIT domain-containing protein [unclassified Cyanobium]|uniref:HIT domain-containing protein n=1 Tax=unclassified Cyanobium TaxID=2627006 RepID=UPI0028F44023|nr:MULTISPECIES: HIT domain-containing protein [unclassified Cyanobium]